MAEVEFAGMTFKGGKMMILLTALSTLGGSSWAVFEFYKDYTDMKEIVQNIDVDAIKAENALVITKLDEAIDYSRSIKNDLRDDFNRMEANVDRVEDMVRSMENEVNETIDTASERFDNKRDSLYNDTELKLKALEDRLNQKIQNFLDNPLAN
jgi:replication-associated recombination protein RarA